MTAKSRIGGAVGVALAAVLVGGLAPLLNKGGLVFVAAALGLLLAAALINFRTGSGGERAWHPVLMLLTGLAVLMVAWSGFPPKGVGTADLLLVAALIVLLYCWVQGTVELPLPGWLLGAATMLIASQLLNQFFLVTDPPPDPPPSFTPGPALVAMMRVELGLLVLPIVVGAVASSWRRANLLANVWVLSATISAAIGTIDSATGAGIGPSITGIAGEAGRAAGLSHHPNALALTCDMALPVALLRAAQFRGIWRIAAIASSGLLLMGILASGSRVGLVGAVLVVFFMGMLIARLRARIVAAGVAAIVVFAMIAALAPSGNSLFSGFDRLGGSGSANGATTQRIDQLHDSLHLAWGHPFTGIGFQVVADAHNLPVQFWESAGVLGILALLLYSGGVFTTAWRLARDPRLPRGSPDLVAALAISFAVWLICGLLQDPIADRYIYMPVGLLLGLGLAAKAKKPEPQAAEPLPGQRPARAGVSAPANSGRRESERVPVAS